jgi:hypothetical protein
MLVRSKGDVLGGHDCLSSRVSEIKGTDVSRLLPATGLARTVSGEGQDSQTLFENSSAWLSRQTAAFNRVDQVLSAANRAYEN